VAVTVAATVLRSALLGGTLVRFQSIRLTYLYTSGTTGLPKACALTHRNYTAMTQSVVAMEGLVQSGDSVLLFLPLAHNLRG
jgi:long-subunit acyl-CoA synthetase (AMP-forming)